MFALLTGFLLSHGPKTIHLIVDGVPREALVLAPTQVTASTPVIFGFHGHMGTAFQASRSFGLQNVWPQALCVYPQGLPTATKLYDPEGKFNGWDVNPAESNKDIRFFDALYQAVFQQYGGDRRHTYAMGHSNGGYFMYTLWQMRPGAIAAFGSFEAAKGVNNPTVPKPLFVSIGSRDALVAPFLQRRSLKLMMELDGCSGNGTPFGSNGTLYPGIQPVALWAYDGGHSFPADSVSSMVGFFKRQTL